MDSWRHPRSPLVAEFFFSGCVEAALATFSGSLAGFAEAALANISGSLAGFAEAALASFAEAALASFEGAALALSFFGTASVLIQRFFFQARARTKLSSLRLTSFCLRAALCCLMISRCTIWRWRPFSPLVTRSWRRMA